MSKEFEVVVEESGGTDLTEKWADVTERKTGKNNTTDFMMGQLLERDKPFLTPEQVRIGGELIKR